MPANSLSSAIIEYVKCHAEFSSFKKILSDLLIDLCAVPTIPEANTDCVIENESRLFNRLIRFLRKHAPRGSLELVPVSQAIHDHPFFTPPYYSASADVYHGRNNLLYTSYPSAQAGTRSSLAFNAHIDTVAPFIPAKMINEFIHGRGAADDKGGCAAIAGAFLLLKDVAEKFHINYPFGLYGMFVIDEETGGNGSLSMAIDRDLCSEIDTLVVVESFGHEIYPANRGAVWYKIETKAEENPKPLLFMARIIKALEQMGRTLRKNSEHSLFPDKPVQTCQGILGAFGSHPSMICSELRLIVSTDCRKETIEEIIQKAQQEYFEEHESIRRGPGDISFIKIHQRDPDYLIEVTGTSGHMGSSLEKTNAITLSAYLIEILYESIQDIDIQLSGNNTSPVLILEGGQGFLPTHSVAEIRDLLDMTVSEVWKEYTENTVYKGTEKPVLSTEKLHNEAFERKPDSKTIKMASGAASLLNIDINKTIVGAPVSCDARIFAHEYPELEVFTTGPGSLSEAHTDDEKISISDLCTGAAFLSLFTLFHQGILNLDDF